MRIGYARVSTADQNPDLQEDALQKAGVGAGAADSFEWKAFRVFIRDQPE